MRTLSRPQLEKIRRLLDFSCGTAGAESIAAIDRVLKSDTKRASSLRKRTAPRRAARREKTSSIRAAVMARAGGRCENCQELFLNWAPEMDHFFGGSKKRSHETVDRCWMLCRDCHRSKTINSPSRDYWLAAFLRHRRRHGLRAVGL